MDSLIDFYAYATAGTFWRFAGCLLLTVATGDVLYDAARAVALIIVAFRRDITAAGAQPQT